MNRHGYIPRATSMSSDPLQILIVAAMPFSTEGISGGDKIFMELGRAWAARGLPVTMFASEECVMACDRYGVKGVRFDMFRSHGWAKWGFAIYSLIKLIRVTWKAFFLRLDPSSRWAIFSASDHLPDVIPAAILRMRYPASRWLAAFYFFAPTPWYSKRDVEYRGGRQPPSFRSILYFLFQQLIAYPWIKHRADGVLVCNPLDIDRMKEDGISESKILPIYGGVDLAEAKRVPVPAQLKYDACFVGRFHIQKGPLALIDIWSRVVQKKPDARLAVIGSGPLEAEMRERIRTLRLESHITLLGYVDGEAKYHVLKQSRLFLHTPTMDTGGMAAAEAMAAGLPVLGFDLPGYRHCYPRGMRKIPLNDLDAFAEEILKLLSDAKAYNQLRDEAVEFAECWDWNQKASDVKHLFDTLLS